MESIITTVESQCISCINIERKPIAWIFGAYGQIPPSPFRLVIWEAETGEKILTYPPAKGSLEERSAKEIHPCEACEENGKVTIVLPKNITGTISLQYWINPVKGLLIKPIEE